MGAWGHGILQNDTAQDGLVGVIHTIYDDVVALEKKPTNAKTAARLGAGVGLLLQLSAGYWFSDDGPSWPKLREVLAQHERAFADVSPEVDRLLADVLAGKGRELAARDGPPDARLGEALFATNSDGFPMERTFGLREPALFAHKEAARYVQEVADRLVKQLDDGFADDDVVAFLDEEAEWIAALAVLLVLEPCRVDPDHFASWRARFRRATAADEEDVDQESFEARYGACLERAFQIGIDKFAAD